MEFELLKKLYLSYFGKCESCKDCLFYSGMKCHGYGDYYGTCLLLYLLHCYCKKNYLNYHNEFYDYIVFDDTNCILYNSYDYVSGGD